jgi:hypothetical protein
MDISSNNLKKRLDWAKKYKDWHGHIIRPVSKWQEIMFSDESWLYADDSYRP